MSKEFEYDSDTEVGKYKKNTESNVSKANKKSKHKHQYEECLIQYKYKLPFGVKDKIHTGLQSYCIICGKLGNRFNEDKSIVMDYRIKVDSPIGMCWKLISDEELYEKYHNRMPVFFVEDLFSDYVNLEEKNDLSGE